MVKNRGGRPTTVTPEVLLKLREGFAYGLTDEECCLHVGISVKALYYYENKHPKFREQKALLKQSPTVKAKFNVNKKLEDGDSDISKWYLERRSRQEFGNNVDVTTAGKPMKYTLEIIDKTEDVENTDDKDIQADGTGGD
jgi:hypothetical protein